MQLITKEELADLIFENKELCDMMDVRVFVDTDYDSGK